MDALKTLADVAGKFGLADILESLVVRDGAELVELPEKSIKIDNRSRVVHELVPVVALWQGGVLSLHLRDDLFEIPRESQHIAVFGLAELHVSSNSLVELGEVLIT